MQRALAVISLKNILHNARLLQKRAGKPLIAVVKDDAYGHGAEEVALALNGLCDFAVATAEEGAALRVAGVTRDILVLTPALSAEEVVRIAEYDLTASISSLSALNLVARTASVRAHLTVNTGMNRYGFRPDTLVRACRAARLAGIQIEGVYSHLFDASSAAAREEQIGAFRDACEVVEDYFSHPIRHISATGGLFSGDGFDAVRVGIGLYGYAPVGFSTEGLRPSMKLYATVSHACRPFGSGAGYQRAERAYGHLHTLRVGYGDGLFRAGKIGNVGKLCMDAAVFEGDARIGRRKRIVKDISAYARAHGTTEYEALVNLAKKAEKRYLK